MINAFISILDHALFRGAPGVFVALALAFVSSCDPNGSSNSEKQGDTLTVPSNTDDEDTGSEPLDTEAVEPFPADLRALCSTTAEQLPASEDKPDIEAGPRGDGRHPAAAVARENGALMAWAYKAPDSPSEPWTILTAAYDESGGIAARQQPIASNIASRTPSLAAHGDVFGLVWRDARWDPDCGIGSVESCRYNLAFCALDSSGVPIAGPEPTRLTYETHIESPPAIASTSKGWLVAGTFENAIFTLPLDESGEPGLKNALGTERGVKTASPAALATAPKGALIAWISQDEWSLLARPLDEAGAASGKTRVIAEGSQVRSVSLAATPSGYILAWSQAIDGEFEAFALSLDFDGHEAGEAQRLTWNSGGVDEVDLAWDGTRAALAFVAPRSGDDTGKCSYESCNEQVFLRVIDENGSAVSRSVRLSADPNPSAAVELFFDGAGFTAAWETRRQYRQQVYYGRAVCSE